MAGLTPLPPTVVHTSTRLTHGQAHSLLSTFLSEAENNAAYRPDSTLTERGPQSASTGANSNLTLHHLRRILQGIEGKRIGGEDVGRFFGNGPRATSIGTQISRGMKRSADGNILQEFTSSPPLPKRAKREMVESQHPEDGTNDVGIAVEEEGGDGWQDKNDYELAQREDVLGLLDEDRQPGMNLEQPVNDEDVEEMVDIKVKGRDKRKNQEKTTEKEDRKRAKKARKLLDKKERSEARQKQ